MLSDPQVCAPIDELQAWPGTVLSSHKSAGHPVHKLTFLADLGLAADDAGMAGIVERVMEHRAPEGPFQVLMNIPTHFGGTGLDQWAWALCDAPLLVYALAKLGLREHPAVVNAARHLSSLVRANGWPCGGSLGKFRGPGRKEDPCPYATLAMLKLLAVMDLADTPAAHAGVDTLLGLWRDSRARHPYMFYMGTDFRKLKAPLVWYDLLHVLDTLTQFQWLRGDPRLADMLNAMASQADEQARYTPSSAWQAWGAWEFGQKKVPSRWVTLLATRALRRSEGG